MTKVSVLLCFPDCTKCGNELSLVVLEKSVACIFSPIFIELVLIPYKKLPVLYQSLLKYCIWKPAVWHTSYFRLNK